MIAVTRDGWLICKARGKKMPSYIIQADTPQETKDEIVKWLKMNASNHRIAAAKSSRVAVKVENTTLAAAYQGAADFLAQVKIEPKLHA